MSNKSKLGKLFVISAPSGAGKTTLCDQILSRLSGIMRSISSTTRPKRKTEMDGKDYFFTSEKDFKKKIESNQFAEWALVHGYYYGTNLKFIEEKTAEGIDIILNIDVQGGQILSQKYPNTVTIFIHPPSFNELKKRLRNRSSDSETTIQKRLEGAKAELEVAPSYQYHIVNDDIEKATLKLITIIESERKKT